MSSSNKIRSRETSECGVVSVVVVTDLPVRFALQISRLTRAERRDLPAELQFLCLRESWCHDRVWLDWTKWEDDLIVSELSTCPPSAWLALQSALTHSYRTFVSPVCNICPAQLHTRIKLHSLACTDDVGRFRFQTSRCWRSTRSAGYKIAVAKPSNQVTVRSLLCACVPVCLCATSNSD